MTILAIDTLSKTTKQNKEKIQSPYPLIYLLNNKYMSLHILSQGLAYHDIVTTRHMLITHVYHCSLVIIQMVKGFTSKAMIYAIAVHLTYIKTLDFYWQLSTPIQPKERSAGIINIEGRAKNDNLSEVHF